MKNYLKIFILFFLVSIVVSCEDDSVDSLEDLKTIEELEYYFGTRQLDSVIIYGKIYLDAKPKDSYVNYLVGRSYTETARYENGIDYLEKSIKYNDKNDWEKAWSYCVIGRCYFFTGNFESSLTSFNTCIEMNATANSVSTARFYLQWFFENDMNRWEIVNEENIKFYFQNKSAVYDLSKYLTYHEKAYSEIELFFNSDLSEEIYFFVWHSSDDAYNVHGRSLAFARPSLYQVNTTYGHTYGHELAHVIMYQTIKPTVFHHLINEGIAVYLDQTTRDRVETAKIALNGELLDMDDIWANPDDNFELIYPLGGAFIEFLLEKGNKDQLFELLAVQSRENAIKIYPNYKDLEAEFELLINE